MTSIPDHILIVDDEKEIREPLARYLAKHGFRCSLAKDGKEMDKSLACSKIDLIVLDVMMPQEDGLSICRRIQEKMRIPIILLTALSDDTDRIVGLEIGADDYLTKPFNPRELLARIKSVIRRSRMLPLRQYQKKGLVQFAQWRMNLSQKEIISVDDIVIRLSSGEHMLLVSLIEHAGITLN
ncbi:MAG: response regulator, partial [Alcanivoracaceae bacterium]|nr:response regulator [Alcanivoracaceae bacterium]